MLAGCPTHSRFLRMSGFRHTRNVWRSQSSSEPGFYSEGVTKGLHRYYGAQDLHFITAVATTVGPNWALLNAVTFS
jgi:hypothetical protein